MVEGQPSSPGCPLSCDSKGGQGAQAPGPTKRHKAGKGEGGPGRAPKPRAAKPQEGRQPPKGGQAPPPAAKGPPAHTRARPGGRGGSRTDGAKREPGAEQGREPAERPRGQRATKGPGGNRRSRPEGPIYPEPLTGGKAGRGDGRGRRRAAAEQPARRTGRDCEKGPGGGQRSQDNHQRPSPTPARARSATTSGRYRSEAKRSGAPKRQQGVGALRPPT